MRCSVQTIVLLQLIPALVLAAQPPYDFSGKSVPELRGLLQSKDPRIRQSAAAFLGVRYRDPEKMVQPDVPIISHGSPPPDLPAPLELLDELNSLLRSDTNVGVRLCALGALEDLRYRADTSPIIRSALTNSMVVLRIRAADALGRIAIEYKEKLPPEAVTVLIDCLDPSGNPDEVWQAAYTIGQLGPKARAAIPALLKLADHKSKKVRSYAQEALGKVGK